MPAFPDLSRRTFLSTGAALGALAATGSGVTRAAASPREPAPVPSDGTVPLRWLDGSAGGVVGATWGVPWPAGAVTDATTIGLRTASGDGVPVQSWPTAIWPDGTIRKIRDEPYEPDPNALSIGLGTDWSGLAAAWLTAWERTGDEAARAKLLGTMADIGAMQNGFITGSALYDLDTGRFATDAVDVSVSHLSAMFGLVEMCSEVLTLTRGTDLEAPGFADAWLQYCRLYNATREEQTAEVGAHFGNLNLRQPHCRLTAYAGAALDDDALRGRAWDEFFAGGNGYGPDLDWVTHRIEGPAVLAPVDEAAFVSTNASSQYALAAIQTLALVGDALPPDAVL
ncbi:hypothetical protein EXU48_09215 [Occultella glacieicola]|uniref:PcRGLX/YetA-like C-terminal alpha/alpha toroid domain-containing protein n=1 Tax=Occultella glacieicola TaxID=2518684 RepID=A0ABY2E4J6_9MICO|nr:twin-arginine translocation signal domain-containing protein [Occultella glacieicola]TDE94950.1 hypothetical protein EXU48_09215 [Occultella glacieicola]